MPPRIGDPSDKDIRHVYSHMRKIDRKECANISGRTPKDALLYAIAQSDEVRCGYVDDEAVSIWGYGEDTIWMLGTPNIRKAPLTLMKQSHDFLNQALTRYTTLSNWIDAENTVTLLWLKRLGFVIFPAMRVGVGQRPCHFVYIQRGTSHV